MTARGPVFLLDPTSRSEWPDASPLSLVGTSCVPQALIVFIRRMEAGCGQAQLRLSGTWRRALSIQAGHTQCPRHEVCREQACFLGTNAPAHPQPEAQPGPKPTGLAFSESRLRFKRVFRGPCVQVVVCPVHYLEKHPHPMLGPSHASTWPGFPNCGCFCRHRGKRFFTSACKRLKPVIVLHSRYTFSISHQCIFTRLINTWSLRTFYT